MAVQVQMSKEQELALEKERRPGKRADLSATAIAFTGNAKDELTFRNISTSGAALTTRSEMSETQLVLLTFKLPGSSPGSSQSLAINSIIVRKESLGNDALIGVEFIDPSDQAVVAIEQYVHGSRS